MSRTYTTTQRQLPAAAKLTGGCLASIDLIGTSEHFRPPARPAPPTVTCHGVEHQEKSNDRKGRRECKRKEPFRSWSVELAALFLQLQPVGRHQGVLLVAPGVGAPPVASRAATTPITSNAATNKGAVEGAALMSAAEASSLSPPPAELKKKPRRREEADVRGCRLRVLFVAEHPRGP